VSDARYRRQVEGGEVSTVATDAGLLALWRSSAFNDVDGYPAWERRVEDRLAEAVRDGELVPIGIGGDGAFAVRVAIAPEGLSEREARYTVTTSQPYLLVSDGAELALSGIEGVGDLSRSPLVVSVPEGRYAARIVLVAWDEEPGGRGDDGRPSSTALPDFVVMIELSDGTETFRLAEETFDPSS